MALELSAQRPLSIEFCLLFERQKANCFGAATQLIVTLIKKICIARLYELNYLNRTSYYHGCSAIGGEA